MTFMHMGGRGRLILCGRRPSGTSGHCYRGNVQNESARFVTLRDMLQSVEADALTRVSTDELDIARQALSGLPSELEFPTGWFERTFKTQEAASAVGRVIEASLLNGCLQGWILRRVIDRSCASDEQLISLNADSQLGQRPIQQPPNQRARLGEGIAAKVAPWLNLSEFLQQGRGIGKAYRVRYPEEQQRFRNCSCARTPERYEWRNNVRRMDPLAQPFFGLYEPPDNADPQP